MASLKFVFYLTCLLSVDTVTAQRTNLKFSSTVYQETRFVSATIGDLVSLRCSCDDDDDSAWLYWYKQSLGYKPQLISTFYKFDDNGTFYGEFKNNPRFALNTGKTQNHLTILGVKISDSATYYCASSYTFFFNFANGTVVSVTGSGVNVPVSVHQSSPEIIQPGGSVTLNCTVHTGSCGGEHSVYWFKTSQEESHPGLIYTHGGRNDQCERKDDTQTHTCVYNLPMESLNLSHAGTYYCAVASCGHILFGDGTKLDMEDRMESVGLVHFLSGALAFNTILVVLLAISMYKMKRSCLSAESHARSSAPSTTHPEAHRNADSLHYAALSINLPNRSRRQRNNTDSECVYSSVRQ